VRFELEADEALITQHPGIMPRSAFEAASAEPERIVESGEQVVAVVRSRLRPRGSSGDIELRTGFLWTFRDGKVVSLRLFDQPEEALEAAGRSE
jgi:ketosteroid isomerase-like protein